MDWTLFIPVLFVSVLKVEIDQGLFDLRYLATDKPMGDINYLSRNTFPCSAYEFGILSGFNVQRSTASVRGESI